MQHVDIGPADDATICSVLLNSGHGRSPNSISCGTHLDLDCAYWNNNRSHEQRGTPLHLHHGHTKRSQDTCNNEGSNSAALVGMGSGLTMYLDGGPADPELVNGAGDNTRRCSSPIRGHE